MLTKDQALKLNEKGSLIPDNEARNFRKFIIDNDIYEVFNRQAIEIAGAIKSGSVDKPVNHFANHLDFALKYLNTNGFSVEAFKEWPEFRDLLIKRRVLNFKTTTEKKNRMAQVG